MAQLPTLMKSVGELSEPAKRKISSILGAVVADAASLPLEWIYDDAKMKETVGDKNPEFWPECKCPFFTVPCGNLSCYGDEMATSLKSVASNGSIPCAEKISGSLCSFFGSPDSPYQVALARRAEKKYPVPGPWINGGVIKFLKNVEDGRIPPGSAECEDNDGFTVSLPVFLKDSSKSEDVAKLLTTNDMILSHLKMQSRILENYLNGVENPVESARTALADQLPEVCKEMDAVKAEVDAGKSVGEIIDNFGKACSLPGSFQGSVAVLFKHKEYVSAVRENILGGGDCCSRGNFIGACLGAASGVEFIPMEWIEKVSGIEGILEAALQVYQN